MGNQLTHPDVSNNGAESRGFQMVPFRSKANANQCRCSKAGHESRRVARPRREERALGHRDEKELATHEWRSARSRRSRQ